MSGILVHKFRQGNRSELLADYLLSAIGITTPVRRQDDFGFDFHCQLSDQELGNLTFGYPFLVQIKSDSSNIMYGETLPEKWKSENISWLFRQEVPFLIGVVNKKNISVTIFRTTGIWNLLYAHPTASQIELVPRPSPTNKDVDKDPHQIKIEKWDVGKGDGYLYQIDLGDPIITLSYDDLDKPEILKEKKNILRQVISLEQINFVHKILGIRHYQWVINNTTDKSINKIGFMVYSNYEENSSDNIYKSISGGLILLAMHFAQYKKVEKLKKLQEFLKIMPQDEHYKQFKKQFPDAFEWVNE